MYSRSRQHHCATRVGGWTALGLLMVAVCAAPSHVESASSFGASPRSLNIPSQPLEQALQEFARQSGMQIVFRSKVTDGWQSPAIEGTFIAEAGLVAMLLSTPLQYRFLNENTIEITPRNPTREKRRRLYVASNCKTTSAFRKHDRATQVAGSLIRVFAGDVRP